MALSLVELVSSGASSRTGGGGIGLTCHTNNEVVKVVIFIQSRTDGRGGRGNNCTKTLESDIVIPDDDAEAEKPTLTLSFRTTWNYSRQRYYLVIIVPMKIAI